MSEFITYTTISLRDDDNCKDYECGDVVEVIEFYENGFINDGETECLNGKFEIQEITEEEVYIIDLGTLDGLWIDVDDIIRIE